MNVPEYSLGVFQDFATNFLLKDKKVLEVGGHLPAQLVLKSGVRQWDSISLNCLKEENLPGYRSYLMDCRKLYFPDEEFDYVFSCAAFEHINDLQIALNEMYRVLKKNGILFSAFGPIWSSYCGHHLEFEYQGKKFDFNSRLLPSWSHLYFSREEMKDYLLKNYKNEELVNKMVSLIYETKYINRLFYEDYLKLFTNGKFVIYHLGSFANRFDLVPDVIQLKLKALHPDNNDFSSYGMKVVLLKI